MGRIILHFWGASRRADKSTEVDMCLPTPDKSSEVDIGLLVPCTGLPLRNPEGVAKSRNLSSLDTTGTSKTQKPNQHRGKNGRNPAWVCLMEAHNGWLPFSCPLTPTRRAPKERRQMCGFPLVFALLNHPTTEPHPPALNGFFFRLR